MQRVSPSDDGRPGRPCRHRRAGDTTDRVPPGRHGHHGRHDHRVVRLLHLRQRRRAAVRQAVLQRPGQLGAAGLPGHDRRELLLPPGRCHRHGPAGRPDRPAHRAHLHPHPHGRGDHARRPVADELLDRHLGTRPAHPAALPAGLLGRRGVGRRGHARRRARTRAAGAASWVRSRSWACPPGCCSRWGSSRSSRRRQRPRRSSRGAGGCRSSSRSSWSSSATTSAAGSRRARSSPSCARSRSCPRHR